MLLRKRKIMQCEKCGCQEATIHLTQVVDGKVKKLHLCESCAEKSGFDLKGPMSITDILLGLGAESSDEQEKERETHEQKIPEKICQTCSMSRSEFKRTGRLGCPACYAAFEPEIMPLLKAMHRSQQHIGKTPMASDEKVGIYAEFAAIQKELEEAVACEAYEKAAALRDKLQSYKARMEK